MDNKLTRFLSDIRQRSYEASFHREISSHSDFVISVRIIAALLIIAAMSVYYYGLNALLVTIVTTAACCAADVACILIRGKRLHMHDLSAVVTGLTLSMMLPSSVSYTTAAAAAVFAICIAKHPFGGHGHEIFNAAAAGWIFASLSFPDEVLLCPKPFTLFEAENSSGNILYQPGAVSSAGISGYELLIGAVPSPMGTGAVVLLAVCAVILIASRVISGAVLIISAAAAFVCGFSDGGFSGAAYELCKGMLIFGAVFLLCDFNIVPKIGAGRILYGLICGLLIIVMSNISSVENPVVYTAVISAPFAGLCNEWGLRITGIIAKRKARV